MTEDAQGYVIINGRRYPSAYVPGAHWALDEAWQILDTLSEGAIADENRAWLAGAITGALTKKEENSEARKFNDELMDTNQQLRFENRALREGSALIVHALDCAVQLTEALFIFLPEGTVLPAAVSTCKHALDQAMHAIRERKP